MNAPLRNHLQVCRNRKVSIYVIAMQGKFTEIHYHSGFIKKINFTVQYGTYSASQISKNKPTPNSCYF